MHRKITTLLFVPSFPLVPVDPHANGAPPRAQISDALQRRSQTSRVGVDREEIRTQMQFQCPHAYLPTRATWTMPSTCECYACSPAVSLRC
ncbi:Hypothetical protein, putative, partial [Bodo saltans]